MNATIEKIVGLLFEDLEESAEVSAIREEILQNCQERYQDLREGGLSEDDAIHAVIESLNGMEEMLSAYPRRKEPPAAEPAAEKEQTDERSWSCDPALFPIHEIRMEHMNRADVYVCVSEDEQVHVTCSNPELTLMTGMEDGVLTVALSEEKTEDIHISADDLKASIEKGFDLSSIGRFFEKVAKRFTASLASAEVWLYLPESLHPALSIHTASGNVSIEAMDFEKLLIGTASGDVELEMLSIRKELRVASASGDIQLKEVSAQLMQLSSTSGDMDADGCGVRESARINTTSGDIEWNAVSRLVETSSISGDLTIAGSAENLNFNTVSGDVRAALQGGMLQSVNGKTTSGDISLTLPQGLQANVSCHTVSGDVSSHVPSIPGAAAAVTLSSVSGDITVR